MQSIALLALAGVLLYLSGKLLSFIKALQAIQYVEHLTFSAVLLSISRYHPGKRALFSPASLLGSVLPEIRWVSYGKNQLFTNKHQRACL